MKLFAISDMHGQLPDANNIPVCDVVVIAGDIVPLMIQRKASKSINWLEYDFYNWVEQLRCQKVIFIAGNHDFFLDPNYLGYDPIEIIKKSINTSRVADKLVYLEANQLFEYNGKTFYSFPWISDLRNWAFYKTHEELVEECNKIPNDLDVLITHQPPRVGQAGMVLQSGRLFGSNFGGAELEQALKDRNINICICGHIHSGNKIPQIMYNEAQTKIYNVSILGEDYQQYYNGTEIEL